MHFTGLTWKVKTICEWNSASLCLIIKEKISSKNSAKTAAGKVGPGSFVFVKN